MQIIAIAFPAGRFAVVACSGSFVALDVSDAAISPVTTVLVAVDPTGANQLLDGQEIITHRHVRHPFSDRLLHFLRRFIRSIKDRLKGKLRIGERAKKRMAERLVFKLQFQLLATGRGQVMRRGEWGRKCGA